jgi:hypothetical protein
MDPHWNGHTDYKVDPETVFGVKWKDQLNMHKMKDQDHFYRAHTLQQEQSLEGKPRCAAQTCRKPLAQDDVFIAAQEVCCHFCKVVKYCCNDCFLIDFVCGHAETCSYDGTNENINAAMLHVFSTGVKMKVRALLTSQFDPHKCSIVDIQAKGKQRYARVVKTIRDVLVLVRYDESVVCFDEDTGEHYLQATRLPEPRSHAQAGLSSVLEFIPVVSKRLRRVNH